MAALQVWLAFMRRLKIAVTGTHGLIGSLLMRRLEVSDFCRRIVLLDLVPPRRKLRKAVFYRIDLTDPLASNRIAEALDREEPDVVVHLAFLQHPIRDAAYEHELESVGTMEILHALGDYARSGGTPRLVMGSSTLLYGARPDNPNFLSEDAPLHGRPGYPFIQEKVDAERQVERFRRASGAPVIVLRTAALLGPGVRTLAGRYFSLPAVPTLLGFNPLIQLLHPQDAVEAFALAVQKVERDGRSGIYNVAADGDLPLLAAIRLVERRSVPLPAFAAYAVADALFQAGAAIAPGAQFDYLRHLCLGDVARAADELGFHPRQSTRETVQAFARARLKDAA